MEKKKSVVISCHPYNRSFSIAIRDRCQNTLENNSRNVKIIDLAEDKYNPLGFISGSEEHNKQVANYRKEIKDASELVLVYPVWWSGMPAHLKGFVDEIFSSNEFVKNEKGNLIPTGYLPKNVYVFTTAFTPAVVSKTALMNACCNSVTATFKNMGAEKVTYMCIDKVGNSHYRRTKFLNKIGKTLEKGCKNV